jgi:hypothetical protein
MITVTPIFMHANAIDSNDLSEYSLEVNGDTYNIPYSVNAHIIAMKIDPESRSLLIGLENTHESQFFIKLENKLIKAQNNEFVVLVNGMEVDYQIKSDSNYSSITFFVPIDSEEVEIIGTNVVPEFPIGLFFVLIMMISTIILFTKLKTSIFRL